MIIFIGFFVLLLNIALFLVSKDVVLFTCVGSGLTFSMLGTISPLKLLSLMKR